MIALYRRFIERVFYHFYREFAWTFDAVAWAVSGGLWFGWIRAALPETRGRVLELGFGTGHLQLALATRAGVVGVDASPQMARAQALPFPEARFDTVVATFPSEYILDPATHQEIHRVLAPGGRLVIVPSAELDPGIYARAIDVVYRLALLAPVYRDPRAAPPPTPLRIAGMRLTRRWARVGPSQAMVLIGEREESPAPLDQPSQYAANH
jgi:SAM-dependent methyltransferase